ncbi:MAG TPA: peptidylprolyl isomerase [Saprospiraceae bacterium]|nr:peptidylprolyl isomerase [Saprospiraceae bacterium]
MIKDKCLLSCFMLIATGMLFFGCQGKAFDPSYLKEKAPAEFTIRFETTKGKFDVRIYAAWSPLAADRLYQLVKHKYFDYAIFYRVTSDYVAQFGSSNRVLTSQWMSYPVPDEPVLHSNKRGTITFARAGKDNRGSDLFINLADNTKLDTTEQLGVRGYPPLGEVIQGMDVVDKLYDIYGDDLMQETGRMYSDRNGFMQAYPGLDYVKKAYLVK